MTSEEAREELKTGGMTVHKVIGLLELLLSHSSSGANASAGAAQGIDGLIICAQVDLERLAEAIETEFPDDETTGGRETSIRE